MVESERRKFMFLVFERCEAVDIDARLTSARVVLYLVQGMQSLDCLSQLFGNLFSCVVLARVLVYIVQGTYVIARLPIPAIWQPLFICCHGKSFTLHCPRYVIARLPIVCVV